LIKVTIPLPMADNNFSAFPFHRNNVLKIKKEAALLGQPPEKILL